MIDSSRIKFPLMPKSSCGSLSQQHHRQYFLDDRQQGKISLLAISCLSKQDQSSIEDKISAHHNYQLFDAPCYFHRAQREAPQRISPGRSVIICFRSMRASVLWLNNIAHYFHSKPVASSRRSRPEFPPVSYDSNHSTPVLNSIAGSNRLIWSISFHSSVKDY